MSIKSRMAVLRQIFGSRVAKAILAIWAVLGAYDTLVSQVLPDDITTSMPRAWKFVSMTTGWLSWQSWLLILASLVSLLSLEYAFRRSRRKLEVEQFPIDAEARGPPSRSGSNVGGNIYLEPEAFRLLNLLYKVQTRYDLHKMVIGRDGTLGAHTNNISSDVNLVSEFFSLVAPDASSEHAFEKLIPKIPISYLRNIPETRWGNPYVLSVTQEGIDYVRSHSN